MRIFLDDEREAPEGWAVCRRADECLLMLTASRPAEGVEALSLDHDLGHGQADGYWLAKLLVDEYQLHGNEAIWPDEIYIHSMNPVGRQNIYMLLIRYAPERVRVHNYAYSKFYDGDNADG